MKRGGWPFHRDMLNSMTSPSVLHTTGRGHSPRRMPDRRRRQGVGGRVQFGHRFSKRMRIALEGEEETDWMPYGGLPARGWLWLWPDDSPHVPASSAVERCWNWEQAPANGIVASFGRKGRSKPDSKNWRCNIQATQTQRNGATGIEFAWLTGLRSIRGVTIVGHRLRHPLRGQPAPNPATD
jgi:hypothetical protein